MDLRESARTFYILTFNLRLFCGFSASSRPIDGYFTGFTTFNREIGCREMSHFFSKHGAFPGSKFPGYHLPVNLRKIRKRIVNWPLIYKMYGHFPVNSQFPVLFFSQSPITGSLKFLLLLLLLFFLQCSSNETLQWFIHETETCCLQYLIYPSSSHYINHQILKHFQF